MDDAPSSGDAEKFPLANAFLKRVQLELIPRLVRATVPFYAVQNDKIVRDRSGVLLRIADRYFILTASHDLEAIIHNEIHLYVGWSESEGTPYPIADARYHLTEDSSRDIAVIALSPSSVPHILSSHDPISLREIALRIDTSPGFFAVCGYPQEWLSVMPDRVESSPLVFISRFHQGERTATDFEWSFDPQIHGLFELTQNAVRHDNVSVMLPPSEGMVGISGCGVWRIADWKSSASWNPGQCKLVAIEHRYNEKGKYVCATWIPYVVQRLVAEYPDLRPSLQIQYPSS
jgi:hypothetical protein